MKKLNLKKIIKIAGTSFAIAAGTLALAACGNGEFSAEKNITVTTREDGSGTKSALMEFLKLKGKSDVRGAIIGSSTPAIMNEVVCNPHAIGYDSLGYAQSYAVKILRVDGVAPTSETVKSCEYVLARPLGLVFQAETLEKSVPAKAFFNFLRSRQAQKIIAKNYVPAAESDSDYLISPNLTGTLAISGSTSLAPLMTELAAKFEQLQPGVKITVTGTGSSAGYNDAKNGITNFGMISEKFVPAKAPNCEFASLAVDGIAIIVNPKNPLENISSGDLRNIYDRDAGGNAVTNWRQLLK